MFTIISIPLIPLRSQKSEKSEMVSQLLFGEQIEILEEKEDWFFVRNLTDDYRGWVSSVSLNKQKFTETDKDNINTFVLKASYTLCTKLSTNQQILLPGGSLIPNPIEGKFELLGEQYQLENFTNKKKTILELAYQYLNSPYLWGGKSFMGIDCSGFVQIIFSMLGKKIPRDASEQIKEGILVPSISESQVGDIAFFKNKEHKIVHVGILISSNQIIHASGYVKIESIDQKGIISSITRKYTHRLKAIKRL